VNRPPDSGSGGAAAWDAPNRRLVQAAREHGADVREHCTVQSLRWRAGRVVGVRYRDSDGAERGIASTLTVGADGITDLFGRARTPQQIVSEEAVE
jgi:2-polyprenyl-6-methoxyphenol hydroxylase-like FAD-dependent oxidoreductase